MYMYAYYMQEICMYYAWYMHEICLCMYYADIRNNFIYVRITVCVSRPVNGRMNFLCFQRLISRSASSGSVPRYCYALPPCMVQYYSYNTTTNYLLITMHYAVQLHAMRDIHTGSVSVN